MSKADTSDTLETFAEDFETFFATSLNGIAYLDLQGIILRANPKLAEWIGLTLENLQNTRLTDYLSISGRVYYSTHLEPLLVMQGSFDEVALELSRLDGKRLPVFANGIICSRSEKNRSYVRLTFSKAVDRRQYERTLLDARTAATTAAENLRDMNASLSEKITSETKERLTAESSLLDERQVGILREQFIAVLGHDLRNPLAAIDGGVRLLSREQSSDRSTEIIVMIRQSVRRMAGLIENVMDFARGKLGGGLDLHVVPVDLTPVLQHVAEELKIASTQRLIECELDLPLIVKCDAQRIAQLVSNLMANALTHGSSDGVVRLRAFTDMDKLVVSVANSGEPIPSASLNRLFKPFTRDDLRSSQQGLGLGLYIASEVARAHGGSLSATSTAQETCFTFQMPLANGTGLAETQ